MANKKSSDGNTLALLESHPALLKVLHKHGVHFCAGCYLTLSAPLEKAAAYHAVPNPKKFLADATRAMSHSRHRRSSYAR